MPDAPVLHLTGPVLLGPDDVRDEAWVLDGRITYERPSRAVDATLDGWVLPGLVDAHCHVGLVATGAADQETTEQQALAERDHGALLLRDAGSAADTRWVDGRDDLPQVVRAGRHVARPRRYQRGYAEEVEPEALADEVRRQARRGDGWVKLVGDWVDRERDDLSPLWPADVLVDAIAAAHDEGARVTAHVFSGEALPDLLAAGIDCLEHGTGVDADTLPLVVEAGVAVVPTLVNIENFVGIARQAEPKFPGYARRMLDLHARRHDTVRSLHETGVRLFAGTDAGGAVAHGRIGEEVVELTRAGLTPLEALDAACWAARAWLGHPALDEGAPADLLVVAADPRQDVAVLADPSAVVLRGRRYAEGGRTPSPPISGY